jgi:hypothetical protein
MLWGGPRRSKTSQALFRVGMRRGGCRQPSPQHSMVVVCVKPSRERRVDLNATVSALAVAGTEKRTKGCCLGVAGGP